MFKFVTIYRRVDDEMALEAFFSGTHLRLMEQLPGLKKRAISRVTGKPGGDSRYHLMVEAAFDSADDFFLALASPTGQSLMSALKQWYDADLITWFYTDSYEEAMS